MTSAKFNNSLVECGWLFAAAKCSGVLLWNVKDRMWEKLESFYVLLAIVGNEKLNSLKLQITRWCPFVKRWHLLKGAAWLLHDVHCSLPSEVAKQSCLPWRWHLRRNRAEVSTSLADRRKMPSEGRWIPTRLECQCPCTVESHPRTLHLLWVRLKF